MGIEKCKLIHFNIITDIRGNLTPIEGERDIPFAIKRTYYLYDVPKGISRAGHAHKQLEQVLIALNGSFDVIVKDGKKHECFHLNQPFVGLYLPNMVWREIDNFSSGAICFVLASECYDERDYYRDYNNFIDACSTADTIL